MSAAVGFPLVVSFVCCWCALWAGRWVEPLCIYQCVLLVHISVHCISVGVDVRRGCMCTGGCGGACLPGWFSVCSGWLLVCAECARGFDWWDSFSVDADVFRCGWCGHSGMGLGLHGKGGTSLLL